jgi:hypothetical protein
VESLHRIVEPGIDLLHDRAQFGEHVNGCAYPGLDLRVHLDVSEGGTEGDAQASHAGIEICGVGVGGRREG